jgi:hypothetical protein
MAIAARIRMIATTIRSSIREKPAAPFRDFQLFEFVVRYRIPHPFKFSGSDLSESDKTKEEETWLLPLVPTHLLLWPRSN